MGLNQNDADAATLRRWQQEQNSLQVYLTYLNVFKLKAFHFLLRQNDKFCC